MKTILATLLAGSALAASFSSESEQHVSTAAEGSAYVLMAQGTECTIFEDTSAAAAKQIHFLDQCPEAGMSVADATHLVENADGSIDLVKETGQPVMRFAAAEGGSHVSYDPPSPLVQLVAVD